jgi:hypothetical protein
MAKQAMENQIGVANQYALEQSTPPIRGVHFRL